MKDSISSDHPGPEAAREHLTLIERILDRADRGPRPTPFTYVAWGLTSAAFNIAYAPYLRPALETIYLGAEVLMLISYILTAWEFAILRRRRSRNSDAARVLVVFAGVTTVLWILKWVWFERQLVDGVAFGFMWSLGFAIALLVYATGTMRPLQIGGVILLASIFGASFLPEHLTTLLAVGSLLGITGPGIYFLLRRSHG